MPLKKSKINKILVISLTNIGDVILTFPVVDILKREIPEADISMVVGPKAKTLFNDKANLDQVHIFDKHQSSFKTIKWILQLRKENFDLVVDLRNTAIPFLIASKYKTSFFVKKDERLHMKQKHLNRLKSIIPYQEGDAKPFALNITDKEVSIVQAMISKDIGENKRFVIISPGAANENKRWSEKGFAEVADQLINEHDLDIVFVGDSEDRKVAQRIAKMMVNSSVNLCGRTDLVELAELFRHCLFAIVNDSAPMHLASYLNIPVLAIFLSTNPKKYGPWSKSCAYVQASKKQEADGVMADVTSAEVLKAIKIDGSKVEFING